MAEDEGRKAILLTRQNIRQRIEQNEERLSPLAAKSKFSQGRLVAEEPCSTRSDFQRDRDRIIHSKAFRRLKHKTQVFIAPPGDHYVSRLTHTLEVAQIARTIARALNLNEDLTEAIALGHDLGHTPFGHAGEEVLDALYPQGFRHNEQSLRVVDVLERDGQGLNLTWEVRDGILKHSKARASITAQAWGAADTLEGQIVKIADSVAYINHDIADAERAGMLSEERLPRGPIELLGNAHSPRIDTMVRDIVDSSWAAVRADENSVGQTAAQYRDLREGIEEAAGAGTLTITMSPAVLEAVDSLREFLFQNVYIKTVDWAETDKAKQLLTMLYEHLREHPEELPEDFKASCRTDSVQRMVCDYVSGMTERFALRMFEELYIPDFELS